MNSYANRYDHTDSRMLFWSEGNRLNTVVDKDYYSYYGYDGAGERTLKMTGANIVLDVNADFMEVAVLLDNVTLYPSSYLVAGNRGYTTVTEDERRAELALSMPNWSNGADSLHTVVLSDAWGRA